MSFTITRALVELKTLDSRINKEIQQTQFMMCKTNKNKHAAQETEFRKKAEENYQSINDLICRRNKIKSAITHSNAVTKVTIGSTIMTVAEAIEKKRSVEYTKTLVEKMRQQRMTATNEVTQHKQRVQNKIDDNIRAICGKESKADDTVIQSVTEGLWKTDPIELFDPLKLDTEIKKLETEIEDFEQNVDFVLSESNALTQFVL